METINRGQKQPGSEFSQEPRNPKRRRVEIDVRVDESSFKEDCSALSLHDVVDGTKSPTHPEIKWISDDDEDGGGDAARPEGKRDYKLFAADLRRAEGTMEKPRSQPGDDGSVLDKDCSVNVNGTEPLGTDNNGEIGHKTGNHYHEPFFAFLETKDRMEEPFWQLEPTGQDIDPSLLWIDEFFGQDNELLPGIPPKGQEIVARTDHKTNDGLHMEHPVPDQNVVYISDDEDDEDNVAIPTPPRC
ncbi:hypothetical protein CRG98_026704 [Punica granatum]|uniref:OmpA-like domain-containing protein n=1 Tax=Punica granatum TaxID=22663 RepID=A0A2I0JA65_PUNGR|nr:hypothetical protein CRG98_026704 [Punica granatum]